MTTTDHRLGPLKKSDLKYPYAKSATPGDDPSQRGTPDNALLNRSEWYEVLYFCNKLANERGSKDARVALKAEHLIHTAVPTNLHSHENITKWLVDNWKMFP